MKDYLWVIVAGSCGMVMFFLFILTISTSSKLITKLRFSKLKLIPNILLLVGGIIDIGILVYILMDVKRQIELINNL